MMSTRNRVRAVRVLPVTVAVLALFGLSLAFAPTDASAGPLTVSSETEVANLFTGAPTLKASLTSVYSETAFSGTLDSAIYWNAGKTIAVYTLTHDLGSSNLTQFDITSIFMNPGVNVANIATAGYITGSPATAAIVTSIDTSSTAFLDLYTVTFRWSALDPVGPGESASVYLTYNALYSWSTFDGITKSASTPVPTLAATTMNPEPATALLIGVGLIGLVRQARRKSKKS